ncbi:MAG: thioredoxin domain-containing protein [Alphaproteobacteria bacterium]|nr:thioredoxin domain-containing protein [Alphaproteobacteria bacterium]
MTENLLAGETSPYLLQHKDNPVHWMPWGDDAFERARAENKPVLLSVGYAACHWCHVMAHESFEKPEIAALMNDLFVNIKVDREERPDVDAIYQTSLAMLGEQGGWPLTMFLTPDAAPFWGGTYFPPEQRYGRPGFPEVLRGIASVYSTDPERVGHNAETLRSALEEAASPRAGGGIAPELLTQLAARLVSQVDPVHGGLRGAPKFPQPSLFQQFWRAWKRTGDEKFRDAVTTTLNRICQGGIYDHLAGGFARYSVDDLWLVPHFEKMLYDNAQLLELLTTVWQETRDPLFAVRIEETVGWVLREMVQPEAGFSSSLDADSEGEEGKFCVWTRPEVDSLLGAAAPLFSQHYGITDAGNWEGKTILNRLAAPGLADAETETALARSREILLHTRSARIPPGKDDKVLADWNGLMIGALAAAGEALGRPEWTDAAARAFAFVRDRMTEDGRLRHSWRAGRLQHPATLDDYANMSRAALLLHEATGDAAYLAQAERWAGLVEQYYGEPGSAGYFFAASDTPGLIVRNKTANDNPTPSGNGVMVEVLARLWLLTGKDSYRQAADAIVTAFSGEVARNFFPLSTLLNASEFLFAPVQVVLVGDRSEPQAAAMLQALARISVPNRVIQTVAAGDSLPDGHPASGKAAKDGAATVYVCRGQTCSLPITEPGALAAAFGGE